MQENAICFISKCIVYHLFLHQTAGYTETLCVCCDVAQLEQTRWDKFALFWCKSAPFERVPSHNSFHSSPENLEWHHLLTKSCQHFFLNFFLFLHWAAPDNPCDLPLKSCRRGWVRSSGSQYRPCFCSQSPGANPKFLTYDCKDFVIASSCSCWNLK